MPQTLANAPFLPPVDGSQIRIEWKHVTAMESGLPMKFPDGETYDLIYPEVTIPESAFNTNPTRSLPTMLSDWNRPLASSAQASSMPFHKTLSSHNIRKKLLSAWS